MLVAVVQVKKVGGEGLGTMFATAGGRVEETVEAEKGCNHVQARTKGVVTGHSIQIVAMARPTYFRVLEEQARRIGEAQSRRMLMRCVAACRKGEYCNCRERRPSFITGAGVGIGGCPGVLGTRPVGDVIGQSPGTAPRPLTLPREIV